MEKVYLLLRNNVESGPFTFAELLQQQLKPTDMLWIEGKSTAWAYLAEMELLPHAEQPDSPKNQEALLSDNIESKADALRQRALSFKPRPVPLHDPTAHHESYSRGHFKTTENEIELIDHRREKNKMLNDVVMTVVIVGLFAGGLYAGRTMINRKEIVSPVATQITPVEKKVQEPEPPSIISENIPEKDTLTSEKIINTLKENNLVKTTVRIKPDTNVFKPKPLSVELVPVKIDEAALKASIAEKAAEDQKKEQVQKKDDTRKEDIKKKEAAEIKSDSQADDKKAGDEKKKGFLRNIFKKKKKSDDNKED
jgi:hypothetical protein